MRRALPLILGLMAALALTSCGKRLSSEQARKVFREMQSARRTLTLEGNLTTSVRLEDQVVEADATIKRSAGVVQLEYRSGRFAGWKIIEQQGVVWAIDPAGKPQPWAHGVEPGGMGFPGRTELLLTDHGSGRVAGRTTHKYTLLIPGGGHARFELAVDARTRYPLQMRRYDRKGRLVSSSVYSSVNYDAQPPAPLPVPAVATAPARASAGRAQTEEEVAKAFGAPLLKPAYVPQTFVLRGAFAHPTPRGVLAELRYSDGLRPLSVLQVRVTDEARRRQLQGEPRPDMPRQPRAQGDRRRDDAQAKPGGRRQWSEESPRGRGDAAGRPQQQPEGSRGWRWNRWRTQRGKAGEGGGMGLLRSRLRGHVIRERRGDRLIIVAGDLTPEELQRVMASIPNTDGQRPAAPSTKF